MEKSKRCEPCFFNLGAQKSCINWLRNMLDQHPRTSLPPTKEIHYFGSAELYAQGENWYLKHLTGLDANKIIGEVFTTYFYDRVPYFHNTSTQIEFDKCLPQLPELIDRRFPKAKCDTA